MFRRRKKSDDATLPPVDRAEPPVDTEALPPLRRTLPLETSARPGVTATPGATLRSEPPRRSNEPGLTGSTMSSTTGGSMSNGSSTASGAGAAGAGGAQIARRLVPTAFPPKPEVPSEGKRLTVGREITLSGEIKIKACDVLVVEGRVEAALTDSRAIEIAEGGVFKGSSDVETAEIAGVYEGDLTVRERLFIRTTGRVSGTIRYGRVEIEAGGVLVGTIATVDAASADTGAGFAAEAPAAD